MRALRRYWIHGEGDSCFVRARLATEKATSIEGDVLLLYGKGRAIYPREDCMSDRIKITEHNSLVEFNRKEQREILTGVVRFTVGNEFFEVRPTSDQQGIEVRSSGAMSHMLRVLPKACNTVEIRFDPT